MINYNGKLTPSYSVSLDISNRAFQYGDGIFESIIYNGNKIKFQEEHWERIIEGVKGLKMEISFTKSEFEEMQLNLLEANNLIGHYARMKLIIWRKTGGLYAPTESEAEFILMAQKTEKRELQKLQKVGLAHSVFLQKSAYSHLKTISTLPYVLAGIEKKERELEELILTNEDGYIAEASSSNIYFLDYENRVIYTPNLNTGCVNGVSRRYLFNNAVKFDLNSTEEIKNLTKREIDILRKAGAIRIISVVPYFEGIMFKDNEFDSVLKAGEYQFYNNETKISMVYLF